MSSVTQTEVEAFRRDGVVALRNVFDTRWLDQLRKGIKADLASPTAGLVRHNADPSQPAYIEDFWCWSDFLQFEDFVRNSPCAGVAAQLLGSDRINLVMDNWFLREAGSKSRPPFHHDISYFDFTGTMCVLWLPLEPVAKGNGIQFVRGSHLWNKLYRRVRFKDGHESSDQAIVNGLAYEPPPDIEADPSAFDLVEFDLNAGDCIYFDMRTLHGSISTTVPQHDIHRYTLRMSGPDGRICYRGDWAKGERAIFEAEGYRNGDAIDGDFFPQLWP